MWYHWDCDAVLERTQKMLPRISLSREEELFLRHWMYDEMHYEQGRGAAKRLQIVHGVRPADLASMIAAAMPDPVEQGTAGNGPPPAGASVWPWSEDSWRHRMMEVRTILAERRMQ